MVKLRENWREKMRLTAERQNLPKVVEVNEKMSKRWGGGRHIRDTIAGGGGCRDEERAGRQADNGKPDTGDNGEAV
jgi:hypothetical protein